MPASGLRPWPHTTNSARHPACEYRHRVHIKRSDIGSFYIIWIINVISSPSNPLIISHALPQIQPYRPCRIVGVESLVIGNDYFHRHRPRPRAVDLSLGVIRFIAVHPAGNDRVIEVREADFVLPTNHPHTRRAQLGELRFGWPLPQTYVEIDTRRPITHGVFRVLNPYADWEIIRIGERPVTSICMRTPRHILALSGSTHRAMTDASRAKCGNDQRGTFHFRPRRGSHASTRWIFSSQYPHSCAPGPSS